jgi:hypothetical protein
MFVDVYAVQMHYCLELSGESLCIYGQTDGGFVETEVQLHRHYGIVRLQTRVGRRSHCLEFAHTPPETHERSGLFDATMASLS